MVNSHFTHSLSNGRLRLCMMNRRRFGRKRSKLILKYCQRIYVEEIRKITKNLKQDSRSPVQDLNTGPPE